MPAGFIEWKEFGMCEALAEARVAAAWRAGLRVGRDGGGRGKSVKALACFKLGSDIPEFEF